MVLLTDEEINQISIMDCVNSRMQFQAYEFALKVAFAATKRALKGVGKESKRMDGTIYLVPDYVEYRKALKEVGLE